MKVRKGMVVMWQGERHMVIKTSRTEPSMCRVAPVDDVSDVFKVPVCELTPIRLTMSDTVCHYGHVLVTVCDALAKSVCDMMQEHGSFVRCMQKHGCETTIHVNTDMSPQEVQAVVWNKHAGVWCKCVAGRLPA